MVTANTRLLHMRHERAARMPGTGLAEGGAPPHRHDEAGQHGIVVLEHPASIDGLRDIGAAGMGRHSSSHADEQYSGSEVAAAAAAPSCSP